MRRAAPLVAARYEVALLYSLLRTAAACLLLPYTVVVVLLATWCVVVPAVLLLAVRSSRPLRQLPQQWLSYQ